MLKMMFPLTMMLILSLKMRMKYQLTIKLMSFSLKMLFD